MGGLQLRVATTHLESPTGFGAHQLHSQQRIAQCRQALALLDRAPEPDVLFAGDMVRRWWGGVVVGRWWWWWGGGGAVVGRCGGGAVRWWGGGGAVVGWGSAVRWGGGGRG